MHLDFFILLGGLAFIFTVVQRRPEYRSQLRCGFYVLLAMVVWDRTHDEQTPTLTNPTYHLSQVEAGTFRPSQASVNIVREKQGLDNE